LIDYSLDLNNFKNNLANLFFRPYYYSVGGGREMGKREIYKVLAMTLDEFTDEIEIIRQICQEYNADQINDDKNDTIMFNFYDSKS
jgi:hypothetical protein